MDVRGSREQDKKTLRVLHIGKYFPPFHGGMETYLRDIMLATTRLQVVSMALVHNHVRRFKAESASLHSRDGSLKVLRAARWMNLYFVPISPTFPLSLRRMIREEKPDILHFHLPNASAFWALLLPSARRLPWVVHWHSDVPDALFSSKRWLKPFAFSYRALEHRLLKRAARIIATSPPYLHTSQALATYGRSCVMIPLGIPPTHHIPIATPCSSSDATELTRLKVLAVGRLSYYKGFNVLLDAVSQVPETELQLVGDGELQRDLKAQASALSIDSRVTFCGALSDADLEAAWAWCDCLCLPSIERTEAFGIVLLEAMSRGKACIVADVNGSGMGWLVEHGVTGLKVKPVDAQALAHALRTANADRAGLERMGCAGHKKFSNQLDIAISARQLRTIYDEVIDHAP